MVKTVIIDKCTWRIIRSIFRFVRALRLGCEGTWRCLLWVSERGKVAAMTPQHQDNDAESPVFCWSWNTEASISRRILLSTGNHAGWCMCNYRVRLRHRGSWFVKEWYGWGAETLHIRALRWGIKAGRSHWWMETTRSDLKCTPLHAGPEDMMNGNIVPFYLNCTLGDFRWVLLYWLR